MRARDVCDVWNLNGDSTQRASLSKYKYSDTLYALERPEGRFPASSAIFHDLATVLVRAADTQSSPALHYSQPQGKKLDKSIREKRGCSSLKRPDVCSRATAAITYRLLIAFLISIGDGKHVWTFAECLTGSLTSWQINYKKALYKKAS